MMVNKMNRYDGMGILYKVFGIVRSREEFVDKCNKKGIDEVCILPVEELQLDNKGLVLSKWYKCMLDVYPAGELDKPVYSEKVYEDCWKIDCVICSETVDDESKEIRRGKGQKIVLEEAVELSKYLAENDIVTEVKELQSKGF